MRKINTLSGYIYEYQKSFIQPEEFWSNIAESFFWRKTWDNVLDYDFKVPYTKWFSGGQLNITENIFERRQFTHADRTALIWEPNGTDEKAREITYSELFILVKKMANVLKEQGVKKGDPVAIYMPMIPETIITILACARIGAIHSVVFGGFSATSLSNRINDAKAKVLVTANGYFRGEKAIDMKESADDALSTSPVVQKLLVFDRFGDKRSSNWTDDRDLWANDLLDKASDVNKAEIVDAEDPLFILYTSGSTGNPKGIVHTTAGYMVYTAYSFKNAFQAKEEDRYFCTADVGWITGHSYVAYGPLLNGNTVIIYEGVPTYPDAGRLWDIIDKHQVNLFYTAPTAIRHLMAQGNEFIENKDLSSLRVLGTVGEPINNEAWHWYHTQIGKEKCPIVDTWWQTETGGFMIAPLAGIVPTKPALATLPLPGIRPAIMCEKGEELKGKSVEGNLCFGYPWPSIARTIWGDHERYKKTYFSDYPGYYFSGDGVKRDEDGYYKILGRVDDVINVSGHRFDTAEIENAVNTHPAISESAVVGFPHDKKGEGIYVFAICPKEVESNALRENIIKGVVQMIGPIAKPDKITFVRDLPKTRSGKIMRRILRSIVKGETENFGDTSTLVNPDCVQGVISIINNQK